MSQPTIHQARAFALIEAVAVLAVVAILTAILVVMGSRARRHAMASDDLTNLRQIGQLTGQYAADNKDLLWGFSWKINDQLSQYPDLNIHTDDINAAAHQAIDIIRRRSDRGRIEIPAINNWIPHIYFSHLPLLDYAGRALPNYTGRAAGGRFFVSAGDRYRLQWISDAQGFDTGKFLPYQPPAIGQNRRWVYSSSYTMPPHFFSPPSGFNAIYQQGLNYNFHNVGFTVGQTALPAIAFPSNKVMLYDTHDRHHGTRQPFHAIATGEARVPMLMVDGSAAIRRTSDANPGWNPTTPTSPNPTTYYYSPTEAKQPWNPPAIDPSGVDQCIGFYRYTRSATLGRDFAGPEIPFQ